MSRRYWAAATVLAALVLTTTACTPDGEPLPQKSSSTAEPQASMIRLAVSGPPKLTAAYNDIAQAFARQHHGLKVIVDRYATDRALMTAVHSAQGTNEEPDLFLADQSDLPQLLNEQATEPVNGLLAARNVDMGDGYERAGLEAFSTDDALQCMPIQVSPMLVFYNSDLVDLTTLRANKVLTAKTGWRFDDFKEAAARAALHPGAKGVYVEPSLLQIAPFLFSGGGHLVDNPAKPTRLDLADKSTMSALQTLLEVVRDPSVTFTRKQLARVDARTRFERGHLGMILGYRDDAPAYYDALGNRLGVMPMPRVGGSATIAKIQGLCLSSGLSKTDGTRSTSADLLADLISAKSSEQLAQTGYLTPASSLALHSDAFADSVGAIEGASIFSTLNRTLQPLPYALNWDKVQRRAVRPLTSLFYGANLGDLSTRLQNIDNRSLAWFGVVQPTESPSPTNSPTDSPSDPTMSPS